MQVMHDGEHIALNTEEHGVMYFLASKLSAKNGVLSLEDLESLPDQNHGGYSTVCLFSVESGR